MTSAALHNQASAFMALGPSDIHTHWTSLVPTTLLLRHIEHTYITRRRVFTQPLLKNLPIKDGPSISIMVPIFICPGKKPVLHMSCVYTASPGMDLLHLLPFLALRLYLFDEQILQVDVRTIEDAGCVAIHSAFLAAENGQLAGVESLGWVVERRGGCAKERRLGYARLL